MQLKNYTPHEIIVFTSEAAARLAEAAKRAAELVKAAEGLDADTQRMAAESAADIWVEAFTSETPLAVYPPSGALIRVSQTRRVVGAVNGVPISVSEFGEVEGLPEFAPETWIIVSGMVLSAAPGRPDLIAPAPAVRDWKGQVVGCAGFDTTPAGAARLAGTPDAPTTPEAPAVPTSDAPASTSDAHAPTVPTAPKKWEDFVGKYMPIFTVARGRVYPTRPEDKNTSPKLVVGEAGRGRAMGVIPVMRAGCLEEVKAVTVGRNMSGYPYFDADFPLATSAEYCVVVFHTHIGFRGWNAHTGDARPDGGFADWPGIDIVVGRIAQGDAGRMGSGEQRISIIPRDTVVRLAYGGRLYGEPGEHFLVFDGWELHVATRDERKTAIAGIWTKYPFPR